MFRAVKLKLIKFLVHTNIVADYEETGCVDCNVYIYNKKSISIELRCLGDEPRTIKFSASIPENLSIKATTEVLVNRFKHYFKTIMYKNIDKYSTKVSVYSEENRSQHLILALKSDNFSRIVIDTDNCGVVSENLVKHILETTNNADYVTGFSVSNLVVSNGLEYATVYDTSFGTADKLFDYCLTYDKKLVRKRLIAE